MLTDDQKHQIEQAEADRIRAELQARHNARDIQHEARLDHLTETLHASVIEEDLLNQPIQQQWKHVREMARHTEPEQHLEQAHSAAREIEHEH